MSATNRKLRRAAIARFFHDVRTFVGIVMRGAS